MDGVEEDSEVCDVNFKTIDSNKKRKKCDSDDASQSQQNEWYVMLHGVSNRLDSYSPFLINKYLHTMVGNVSEISHQKKSGDLKIKCANIKQYQRLLQCTLLGDGKNAIEITSLPSAKHDNCKGVIRNVPLEIDDCDLLTALENVYKTIRFSVWRDGVKIPTKSILLYFSTASRPQSVKIGYLSFAVAEYTPPPIRCYKCNGYGHFAKTCRVKARCANCGDDHLYTQCTNAKKCCNCGEAHSAAYKGCRRYREELKVRQIQKTTLNISYRDALASARSTQAYSNRTLTFKQSHRNTNARLHNESTQIHVPPPMPNDLDTSRIDSDPTAADLSEYDVNTTPSIISFITKLVMHILKLNRNDPDTLLANLSNLIYQHFDIPLYPSALPTNIQHIDSFTSQ